MMCDFYGLLIVQKGLINLAVLQTNSIGFFLFKKKRIDTIEKSIMIFLGKIERIHTIKK